MEIVLIYNGLGNQMSQYAFYLAKRKQCKHCVPFFIPYSKIRHNGSELEKIFNINYPCFLTRLFIRFLYSFCCRMGISDNKFVSITNEPKNYSFTPSLLSEGKSWINFYYGGWHCEQYFKDIESEIKSTFNFNTADEQDNVFTMWKNEITNSVHSVSLHVRRGDFLLPPSNGYYNFQNVTTLDYYKASIAYITEKRGKCDFFVFSDDLEWCRENFGTEGFCYIDGNTDKKSWKDMYLMTLCRDHINANSTFSWWGAWLSKYKDGIVTHPKEFIHGAEVNDFYPKNWIEIL